MNVIYRFTSRVTGKYYVGSKKECTVSKGRMIDRNGKHYNSSCSDPEFWVEMESGNFDLDILCVWKDRDTIFEEEARWQVKLGGVRNPTTYNKTIANNLKLLPRDRLHDVCNRVGQTMNEITVHNSTVSRKDAQAARNGFSNYGQMNYEVLELKNREDLTFKELDRRYNRNGYFKRVLREVKLEWFDQELDIRELKRLMRDNITFIKSCEIMGIPEVVARYHVGDMYSTLTGRKHILAEDNGYLTKEELDNALLKDFLDGLDHKDVEVKYDGITPIYNQRAIYRAMRLNFNSSMVK